MTVTFGNFNKSTVINNAGDNNPALNDFITLFCHYYARNKNQVCVNPGNGFRRLIIKRDFVIKQSHTLTNDRKYLNVTNNKVKSFIKNLFNKAFEDKSFSNDRFDKDKFYIFEVSEKTGKPKKPKLNKDIVNDYVDRLADMATLPAYPKESLRVNKDDAAESLVCLALHYVANTSNSTVSSFQDYLEFDLPATIAEVSLPFGVNELKWYCSSDAKLLVWAVSSFIMAEKIKNSPAVTNISSLSQYTFCHSKSAIGRKFKNDIFGKEIQLPSNITVGEDKVQPADIFVVKTAYMNRLSPRILETDSIAMKFDKLERFYNQNFKNGILVPVSLKQTIYKSSTQSLTIQIKAVNYNPRGVGNEVTTPKLLSDFIMRELLLAKKKVISETQFVKWLDEFIEIEPINYRNYKDQVETTIKFRGTTYNNKQAAPIKFQITTPSSTYNFQRVGGNSWTGGVGFQVVSKILRTDSKVRAQFNKAIGHLLGVKKKYYMTTFGKNNYSSMSRVLLNDLSTRNNWQNVLENLSNTHGVPAMLLFAYNYMKYISSKNVPYTNDLPKLMSSLGVNPRMINMMINKNPSRQSRRGEYLIKGQKLTGNFGADYSRLDYRLLGQKIADYEAFFIFSQIQSVVTEYFKKQYMTFVFSMCTGRGGLMASYDVENKNTYKYLAGTRPMTYLLVGD